MWDHITCKQRFYLFLCRLDPSGSVLSGSPSCSLCADSAPCPPPGCVLPRKLINCECIGWIDPAKENSMRAVGRGSHCIVCCTILRCRLPFNYYLLAYYQAVLELALTGRSGLALSAWYFNYYLILAFSKNLSRNACFNNRWVSFLYCHI